MMTKDTREEWYDASAKVSVIRAEVSTAALALVRGHLLDDVPAKYLSEGLVVAALLGAEMSERDETLIVQMKCTGSIGGYLVECSADGSLRGYTEKKTNVDDDLGNCRYQVTRSVPGRILSQGIAASIDGYIADSLQRRALLRVEGTSGELIEALPDSKVVDLAAFDSSQAVLKKSTPLRFACRCSPERALSMLSALEGADRPKCGESIDITCHMCGRTFTVKV